MKNFEFEYHDEEDYQSAACRSERNLLSAMMIRAVCDAFSPAYCERHLVRAAKYWIFAELTPKSPFSFAWVAIHLDLDPEELQDKLSRQTKGSMEKHIKRLRS